ncbi:MAG: dethiobiotin synthase [Oscillospiraceae bacterium]|nr:dethiobiotin synthase [Oscillospiraceae bacterium]
MPKGIFVTATGTDCGKTYVTGLIVKKLRDSGINAGYYKAALSGADSIAESDAGYVNSFAGIGQEENTLVSYLYKNAVSPHLAARIEGNPVSVEKVKKDFSAVKEKYEFVTVEGSGGIVCPIRYDEYEKIFLGDIVKTLGLECLIVADAGLGTINAVVTTFEYMKNHGIGVKGLILNNWTGGFMQEDNRKMIEEMTGLSIISVVKPGDTELDTDISRLVSVYSEI